MSERIYTWIDKTSWPRGPWEDEPDKIQWTDGETDLPCLIVRNETMGHWCGYVGVAEGHPLFDPREGEIYEAELIVHGGITFGGFCQEDDKQHGICHIPEPGKSDRVFWLGFDCAHLYDLSPRYRNEPMPRASTYRTVEYVRLECAALAHQLVKRSEPQDVGTPGVDITPKL